jgi:type I restriction enzyme S subunit
MRCFEVELAKKGSGSTFDAINRDQIEALEIPLPPVAEQERIAARLTEELEIVERARAAAAQRLATAEALPASLLREVFEGPQWPIVELGDGLERFGAGTSVVAEGRPAGDHEWGVLKVSAVSWGQFRPHENKAVPPGYVPGEHERVRPGDFLISRANTAELAGAVVLVRETPDNLMLSDKTLRLVIDRTVFVPEYLEFALRTRLARTFIEGNATGTSYSMRNISQPTIRAIPVPKPEVAMQRQIVATLSARLSAAEALIARCREELADIEALPAALLRAAFNGAS